MKPAKAADHQPIRERHLWQYQPARDVLWGCLIVAVLALAYVLRGVLLPIVAALILAYLFNPFIEWLEQHRVSRGWGATVLAALMGGVVVAIVLWGGPLLAKQAAAFSQRLPAYLEEVTGDSATAHTLAAPLAAVAKDLKEDPANALEPIVGGGGAIGTIEKVVGMTMTLLMDLMLVPIYFLLFAWRLDRISQTMWRVMPLARYPRLAVAAGRMDRAFNGFFRGRLVIALVTMVLYAIAWGFTGVPYWGLLAIGNGFLTIIPYASLAGWPMAVLLKYLDAAGGPVDWIAVAVWPSLAYLVVQFFEAWVLTPMVQSEASDMTAAAVLISVFIGGALFGFIGMLLAVPVWSCIRIVWEIYVLPKLVDQADHP